MYKTIIVALFSFLFISCSEKNSQKEESEGMQIVVTTNIIYDAVEYIAGQKNTVIALMGAGVDPHLYKASQKDVAKLSNADMLVYNGLHLEGKMIEVLEKLKRSKTIVALGEGVDQDQIIRNGEFETPDPHIWFDALLWNQAIKYFTEQLIELDSKNEVYYLERYHSYSEKLFEANNYAVSTLKMINKDQRVLITAHDAFHYFGRAYQIEVYGLQGISTMSEYGLKDISNLVKFIIDRKIASVFIESSVSEKALRSVVEGCEKKGHEVKIGGMLYSDAMGEREGNEGTYTGMFEYNVNTIFEGLMQ